MKYAIFPAALLVLSGCTSIPGTVTIVTVAGSGCSVTRTVGALADVVTGPLPTGAGQGEALSVAQCD